MIAHPTAHLPIHGGATSYSWYFKIKFLKFTDEIDFIV